MDKIIQENYIDEEAARAFLNDCYNGLDLLPNIPSKISNEITSATPVIVPVRRLDKISLCAFEYCFSSIQKTS